MLRISALISGAYLLATAGSPALAQAGEAPWETERKVLGTNGLEDVAASLGTPAYEFARAVARVEEVIVANPVCTAIRVGENLFLTNEHCGIGCAEMQFRLGYEQDLSPAWQRVYKCKETLRKSENLDYALYYAEVDPDGDTPHDVTFPILALWDGPLVEGQAVVVPQHPIGHFKLIDRSADCVLSDVEVFHTVSGRDTIKHMCDTQVGSSGSPLIDRATGHVLALHWGGRDHEFNMAIPIYAIVADLAEHLSPELMSTIHVASPGE
jgi:lysyl endopeptidase